MHPARGTGGVGQAGFLVDGQGVDVGAQPDGAPARPPARAADGGDDARLGDAGRHLVAAEFTELLGDDAGGAHLLEADLRVLVEVAAPRRHEARPARARPRRSSRR